MSHLSIPNVLSLTPDSPQLLPAWRTLPPRFHRTRIADRRATLFPISSSRGWRMTVPGSARLYVKASDGQHNSSDSESETKKSLGGRGGVVGSVLAAIVLAAGVGFTIVYIKKQTALRNAKEMEVLTPHQEELLVADMEDKGNSDDISPSMKVIDGQEELQFADLECDNEANDVGTIPEFSYSVIESERIGNIDVQDVPQDEPALGDLPVAPDVNSNSDRSPGQGNIDD